MRERQATARFEHLALHDALTGLFNRRALLERLEDALRSSPGRPTKAAILLFDVDEFKRINDVLGHAAGDAVLVHVAAEMARIVRPSDTLARLGGDEFVLIARGVDQPGDAQALARRFVAEASRPFSVAGQVVRVELSVGVAIASPMAETAQHVLERADLAMYATKAERRARAGDASKEPPPWLSTAARTKPA